MFKVNKKDNTIIFNGIALLSLLLILNIFNTFSTTIVKFEEVFVCCLCVFIEYFEHGLWNVKPKYYP